MGSTWWESLRGRISGAWDVLMGRAYAGYSVPDVVDEVRLRVALIQILDDPEMTGAEAKAIATAALTSD